MGPGEGVFSAFRGFRTPFSPPGGVGVVVALSLLACLPAGAQTELGSADPGGTVIVANMNASSVWLVDVSSGRVMAEFPAGMAPHESAVSADGRTVAVTNYGNPGPGNVVQILDIPTASLLREIEIEGYERLHGATFLPGDSLLVLTSERTGELLVVSAADGALRRTVPTRGEGSHMLAPGGDWIWTANMVSGTLSRADPSGALETRTWPAGERTEGLATTSDGREGWTASMATGEVIGVDAESGREITRIDGLQVPYRLAVTGDDGTVVVSDPQANEVVLIDRATLQIRSRVDVAQAAMSRGISGSPSPQGFVLTRDGAFAFVSAKNIDRVIIIDVEIGQVVGLLPAGAGPDGIGYSPVRVGGR